MSRNKKGSSRGTQSQQSSGVNREARRGGKRNKQSVVNERWEKKEIKGRQVRDEEHTYVKPAVEPMNQVQAEFLYGMRSKPVTIFIAPAGVGKSYLAASEAMDWLKSGEFDKVLLTRPAIGMGATLGLLKGGLREKYEPYLYPLVDVIKKRYGAGFYENALSNGSIEFMPLEYIRGKSIDDVVIVDELQNLTPDELYTTITRMGEGCLILLGDPTQRDLRGECCIEWIKSFIDRHDMHDIVEIVEATSDDIVRSGLCQRMVKGREKDTQD
tara:strand:- start:998 stop:1807 length:810 start_codon:yes stop_codon:yes gene_type:complete